jgi:hypothetical protein
MVADDCDRRRRDALRLMTEAALSDAGGTAARVVVLDEPLSPATMAATARRREAARNRVSLVELSPELPHADWRNEVFSLTGRDDSLIREWIAGSTWPLDLTEAFAEIVCQLR